MNTALKSPNGRLLVIGGLGSLGSLLIPELISAYGSQNVAITDSISPSKKTIKRLNYAILDATDYNQLECTVRIGNIKSILLLANDNSRKGINFANSKLINNIIDLSYKEKLRVLLASSYAVTYGNQNKDSFSENDTIDPVSTYNLAKMYGEMTGHCEKYRRNIGFRAIRYPIIATSRLDYSSDCPFIPISKIFYDAMVNNTHICRIPIKVRVPLITPKSCAKATIQLLNQDVLSRTSYNLPGTSATIERIVKTVQDLFPAFKCDFKADDSLSEYFNRMPGVLQGESNSEWGWTESESLEELVKSVANEYNEHNKNLQ